MTRHIISKIILVIAIFASSSTVAQNLRSAYFLDCVPQRQQLNPALMNDRAYVNFPLLFNGGIGVNGNIGLSTFIYPSLTNSRELNTFMHQDVPADEFISKLKKSNVLEQSWNWNLVGFGFYKWGGFNTFNLSFKENAGFYFPKDMFVMLKEWQKYSTTEYNLKDLTVDASAYVELSMGHARQITDRLNAGANLKVLLGGAFARAQIDNMSVYMSQDQWKIQSRGTMNIAAKGLKMGADKDGIYDLGDIGYDSPGLAGWGLGMDLGATYRLLDNLTLSMALTDIGFISWNHTTKGATDDTVFNFDGFNNIETNGDKNDDPNSFDNQSDKLMDDLKEIAKFKKVEGESVSSSLRTTMNVGAEYSLLNNKISFGLLSSTRFSKFNTWTELMAIANFRPAKWFNIAINGSTSNRGWGWGGIINFCPKGFNLFVGTDYVVTQFTPQFAPINKPTLNLNLGINFTIGRNKKELKPMFN